MRFAIEHPAVTALFHIRKSNELKWQWISMFATHLKKILIIIYGALLQLNKRNECSVSFCVNVMCLCYFFSHFSFSLAFGRRCYHSVRVFQQLFVSLRLWWFLLIYIVSYYNSRIPFQLNERCVRCFVCKFLNVKRYWTSNGIKAIVWRRFGNIRCILSCFDYWSWFYCFFHLN